ncbi:MAG: alkaline shock response membrane anchor protein AmaP [Firmicutes bacterium]|nr:alkaline shock response membrane anchor protein AmaP [Bacillota bacterium]
MNVFRRILLALMGTVLLCLSAAIAVFVTNGRIAESFFTGATQIFLSANYRWLLLGIALLALILGILAWFGVFYRKSKPQMVQVESSEGTVINVSLAAVENVIKRAAADVPGVCDVSSRLKVIDEGLGVQMFLSVPQGVVVPATASAAKATVEEQMLAMLGIVPADMKVVVDSIVDK